MSLAELWQGAALLARWFRFAPSEIENLSLEDFVQWLRLAQGKIKGEENRA